MPDTEQTEELRQQYSIEMRLNGSGALSTVQTGNLKPDTPIQTQHHGIITVRAFLDSDNDKLRCQATFRDSDSWNGFLFKDYRGMPVLYDNGIRCRYELTQEVQAELIY